MSQPILPAALPAALPDASPRREFELAAHRHREAASLPPAASRATDRAAPQSVERAIADASQRTGIDFGFLVAQARVESSMDPSAKARTSSATGLYQFIDSTWLETMKRHGARFGLAEIAGQIGTDRNGAAHVADPAQREAILALRRDPQIASLMAAGLAEDNRAYLAPILGREPGHAELYLAHFLGAGGAGRFLSAMADDPQQSAAALFPRPAGANRAIFYSANGAPRSLEAVMKVLAGKLEQAGLKTERPGAGPGAAPSAWAAAGAAQSPALATPRSAFANTRQALTSPATPGATMPVPAPDARTRVQPMSQILREAFGSESGASMAADGGRIERAYSRLRALGL